MYFLIRTRITSDLVEIVFDFDIGEFIVSKVDEFPAIVEFDEAIETIGILFDIVDSFPI